MQRIAFDRSRFHAAKTRDSMHPRQFMPLFLLPLIVFVSLLASSPAARGNDIYVAQSTAGAGTGADCADALLYTYFNTAGNWASGTPSANKIGPGTKVHICGTITGGAGATLFTFQGNGTANSPITLFFENGAVLQTPYCNGSNGCINANGKSYIVIDGGGTGSVSLGTFSPGGTVQNTANGEGLANRQISQLVQANGCNNCTIKNLILANVYVTVKNTPNPLGGSITQMNAITFNGSNWTINNNVIHDCGWCLYDVYANGDANIQIFGNEIYNWDHAVMFATSGASSATGFYFYNNKVHDNAVWEDTISGGSSSDCPYHLDGIHFFGTSGSSMDQIYVYNNWWYGSLSGPCSSGFLFAESTSSSTPAHILNSYFWNNLFDATGSTSSAVSGCSSLCGNANGWVGIFSSSNSITFVSNTMLYKNVSDGTNCYNIGSVTNLTFQDNVINGCNTAVNIGTLSGTSSVDYNFYGGACSTDNNCFIYNGSFEGSFANWKSASGFDSHSQTSTYAGALLNSDGTPQSGSPVIMHGANLGGLTTGALATLAKDTTKGGSRTTNARPTAAVCSTMGNLPCWDMGAYNYSSASSSNPVVPPSGLVATVQ